MKEEEFLAAFEEFTEPMSNALGVTFETECVDGGVQIAVEYNHEDAKCLCCDGSGVRPDGTWIIAGDDLIAEADNAAELVFDLQDLLMSRHSCRPFWGK